MDNECSDHKGYSVMYFFNVIKKKLFIFWSLKHLVVKYLIVIHINIIEK